jgi:rod shape-determining protein MreC
VEAFKACLVYALDPAIYYGTRGAERLAEVPSRVKELISADMENRVMREEVRQAGLVRLEAQTLRLENERLRAELSLGVSERREALWASVIERDPLHWYRSVVVDAGEEQGVGLNAAVLARSSGTLVAVGRVVEVRARTSVVLLVTDELSSVAAYLSSASVEGLVQGQGGSRLRMNYLPPEALVAPGDEVYTSATSVTFPPGILLGTISAVNPRDPFLTFQSVEVRPSLDAAALEEVVILKPRGGLPRPPAGDQEDSAEAPEQS